MIFKELEEEIEVKADEYALEEAYACDYGNSSKHVYQGYFYGFKKGAEFGYRKAIERHDLRKDPNDLPKAIRQFWSKDVLFQTDGGSLMIGFYDHAVKAWYEKATDEIVSAVIAWCEMPEFEEV